MEVVRSAIYDVLYLSNPMTVRQVFYQLVGQGVIAKTEAEYKATVVRLLGDMRRAGDVPFGWIADNTRWMRKPRSYSNLEEALISTARHYRRAIWQTQDAYVEIWLEKDALAGVIYDVTAEWDVPLMVTRGYPSLTFLNGAAEAIQAHGRATYLYYFGDYDPSGLDISRKVEHDIREFAPDAEVYFERVAVTASQIADFNLPTGPTKASDSRSRNFRGESVELDALPGAALRAMVRESIERHVDAHKLNVARSPRRASGSCSS